MKTIQPLCFLSPFLLKVNCQLISHSFFHLILSCSCLNCSFNFIDLLSLDIGNDIREATGISSPRGVLDDVLRCSDSETSSSKTSTSCSETQLMSNSSFLWKGFFRFWKQKSMRRLSSFPPLGVPKLSRRKSNRETHVPISDSTTDHSNCHFKPTWKNFTISELQKATNNFSPGLFTLFGT